MARLIEKVGPCTLAPSGAEKPLESLIETIVYQQLSAKAAGTIFNRLVGLYPGKSFDPRTLLETPVELFRWAGLSRPKTASVLDLARQVSEGRLPIDSLENLDDEEVARVLTTVKGIGPWSVQMFLIFRLGRPDVWPTTDLGIRKGAMRTWGLAELPAPETVRSLGEPLRPHRTVASWYLWASLELPKDPSR